MRREFATELHKQMENNNNIWLVTADLGYGMWDRIRDDFPDRFINTGASEAACSDICVGLALEGKIPFMYTITPFYYRCFETLRTYIDHEKINVKLIGSGRDDDYKHDGWSHNASDINKLFRESFDVDGNYIPSMLDAFSSYWPDMKEEIPSILAEMVDNRKPCFISLKR